jgi:hypothetical protein
MSDDDNAYSPPDGGKEPPWPAAVETPPDPGQEPPWPVVGAERAAAAGASGPTGELVTIAEPEVEPNDSAP